MHAFFQEEGLQPTGIGPTIDTFGENNNLHSRVWVNYQAAAAFQQDSNRNARFVEFDDDRRMALTNDCVQTPLTPLHAVLSPAFIETAVVLGGKVMTGLQALELYAKALKVVDPMFMGTRDLFGPGLHQALEPVVEAQDEAGAIALMEDFLMQEILGEYIGIFLSIA